MANLLDHVNDYLIAQAIVRDPRVAGSMPPLWVEPRDGVPAPGQSPKNAAVEIDDNIVVGLFKAPGVTLERHNGFRRIFGADFEIRVKKAPLVDDIEASIRAALHDKRGWDLAGLYIMESLVFRELQPLGSDVTGFTYVTGYTFEVITQ